MSSRLDEKTDRREERLRKEQQLAADVRRSRRLRLGGGVLLAALAAAVVAVVAAGGGSRNVGSPSPEADAPFGQHYAGLVGRREAAGLPTMMDTMQSKVHFHPKLEVFANGKVVAVPGNIGIDRRVDMMQMAGLHTHEADGTIHVEGVPGARLGQFFGVWGVPFSTQRLGPYKAGGGKTVRMWVNDKPSTAFGKLALADGQRIVVSFGPSGAPIPPGA